MLIWAGIVIEAAGQSEDSNFERVTQEGDASKRSRQPEMSEGAKGGLDKQTNAVKMLRRPELSLREEARKHLVQPSYKTSGHWGHCLNGKQVFSPSSFQTCKHCFLNMLWLFQKLSGTLWGAVMKRGRWSYLSTWSNRGWSLCTQCYLEQGCSGWVLYFWGFFNQESQHLKGAMTTGLLFS